MSRSSHDISHDDTRASMLHPHAPTLSSLVPTARCVRVWCARRQTSLHVRVALVVCHARCVTMRVSSGGEHDHLCVGVHEHEIDIMTRICVHGYAYEHASDRNAQIETACLELFQGRVDHVMSRHVMSCHVYIRFFISMCISATDVSANACGICCCPSAPAPSATYTCIYMHVMCT